MNAEEKRAYKAEWNRNFRKRFAAENGFSSGANYSNGGIRRKILDRDGWRCVQCGMTDTEHKAKWNRPITVDHKNKNRGENSQENLQTLCLSCHGRKDQLPRLRVQKIPPHRETIMQMRKQGKRYQDIAAIVGCSVAGVFKWVKKWEKEGEDNGK